MTHEFLETPVVYVDPKKFRANPRNKLLHPDIDPVGAAAWLLDSIREHGVIIPIVAFPDDELLDGHSRCALAEKAGKQVPVVYLRTSDRAAAYQQAQIVRRAGVFAICVVYRERIERLIEQGKAARIRGLNIGDAPRERTDSEEFAAAWIQTEMNCGLGQRTLIRGVKMLQTLESMAASNDLADRQLAERVANIFRNKGLAPARRMLGEADDGPQHETEEVDCGEWRHDEPESTKAPKARAAKPPADEPEPDVIPFAEDSAPDVQTPSHPAERVFGHTAAIRRIMQSLGGLTEGLEESLTAIDSEITAFIASEWAPANAA